MFIAKVDKFNQELTVFQKDQKIKFRDGEVTLNEGEMYVVPKGKEHKPFADNLAKILIIEPRGVVNTGDSNKSNLTADNDIWI